jgi:hypothetical protein
MSEAVPEEGEPTAPDPDAPDEDTEDEDEAGDEEAAESEDEAEKLQFGLSDEALQAELHSYAAALRQEFELTNNSKSSAPEDHANVERYTRDFFKKNLAHAAAQVVWLSSNSDSDSIRLRASMFIIKEALAASAAEGDPISELLSQLKSPTQPVAPNE